MRRFAGRIFKNVLRTNRKGSMEVEERLLSIQ